MASPRALVRAEVNLERFPFFSPADLPRDARQGYVLKREQVVNGVKVDIEWKVLPHPAYGFPSRFDRDVYRALQQILWEDGIPENGIVRLPSFARLLRIMMVDPNEYTTRCSGWYYDRIVESFKRMKATVVESRNAIYVKSRRQWVTDTFSLIDRYVQKGDVLDDQTVAEEHRIYLSSWYLENLRNRYIKPLDVGLYFLFKRSVSRALYAYLDLCFHRLKEGEILEIEYTRLCEQLMLVPQTKRSLALSSLRPAHEELIAQGFLDAAEDLPIPGSKSFKLRYTPGPRFWESRSGAPEPMEAETLESLEPPGQIPLFGTAVKADEPLALVREFHQLARGVEAHRPSRKEMELAAQLLEQWGANAWLLVRYGIAHGERAGHKLTTFLNVRRYLPLAIQALGLEIPASVASVAAAVVGSEAAGAPAVAEA